MESKCLKDYVLEKVVGKGAFGTVYKAKEKQTGEYCAIKEINISKMDSKQIQFTLNEIRILASVKHPNIVEYKNAFLENNNKTMCIVMELLEGGDL